MDCVACGVIICMGGARLDKQTNSATFLRLISVVFWCSTIILSGLLSINIDKLKGDIGFRGHTTIVYKICIVFYCSLSFL